MPAPLVDRFARGVVGQRNWLLLAAAAIAAWAAFVAPRVEFDRSLENMFAVDDPVLPPFRRLERTFHAGEIVLAAYEDADLISPAGIERSKKLGDEIERISGVESVVGVHTFLGPSATSGLNPFAPRMLDTFRGFTHDLDSHTAALICVLDPQADRPAAVEEIRVLVSQRPSGVIAGEPVMIVDGFRYLEQDGRRLGWISTLLLAAVIAFCFRSVRWMLVPLAVVAWTRLVTEAVLVSVGLRLSIVSSMLTAIITVVAVAAVMHVVVRFRMARAEGLAPTVALSRSIAFLALPVFWSCWTDALGFASLGISAVEPVRDFGLMAATGAMLVMAAIVLIVPGLALAGSWDPDPRRAWGEAGLDWGLSRILDFVDRRPRLVSVVTLASTGVLACGALRMEVETDFTKNFRSDSPIAQSYDFIETRLGGAGVWDVMLPAPRALDAAYLARIRRLQEELRGLNGTEGDDNGLTAVLSLVDVLDAVTFDSLRQLPPGTLSDLAIGQAVRALSARSSLARTLYAVDPQANGARFYRIMLRAPERQSSRDKERLIARVTELCREAFPPGEGKATSAGGAEVTGHFVLLARLIDNVLADQWTMFALATGGIGISIAIGFRSIRLAAAALAPNLLPVLVALGIWGWLGLKVNLGTAMIAAVSMGLSVDSSIHYLADFQRERRAGAKVREALFRAHQGAGRAMAFATLALVVGFAALIPSDFVPTIYFGALVALALFGGMVGNLVVLPLLIRMLIRDKPNDDTRAT